MLIRCISSTNILIYNEHPVALTKLNSFQNRHSNSSKKDSEISVNFMLPKRTVSMFQKEHVSFLEAEMSFLAHLQITKKNTGKFGKNSKRGWVEKTEENKTLFFSDRLGLRYFKF